MVFSERQVLHFLSRIPFFDSAKIAGILGRPSATIHPGLTGPLADGIVGRASQGTAHLPSSRRCFLTAKGIGEATQILGFETPCDFVRAYPIFREWLALVIRRMGPVASFYCLSATMSPGVDVLGSQVESRRLSRLYATICFP